jgi:hypothetical protein
MVKTLLIICNLYRPEVCKSGVFSLSFFSAGEYERCMGMHLLLGYTRCADGWKTLDFAESAAWMHEPRKIFGLQQQLK